MGLGCRTVRYGTVRYGTVRYGMVWYGMVWYGKARYEIGICIKTGDILWVNGPFMCGSWLDIKIYRRDLKQKLRVGEMVEADSGY
jgi:hypothetical protein